MALLIDWENLKLAAYQQLKVGPNLQALLHASRRFGSVCVARAYADWTEPGLCQDVQRLFRAGIEPVYAPGRHGPDGTVLKNSADVRLAIDATDLTAHFPQLSTFVLVTGDGDLMHALRYLRQHGRRGAVIGVGKRISSLLSAVADDLLLYERDVLVAPPHAADRPVARASAPTLEAEDGACAGNGKIRPSDEALVQALLDSVACAPVPAVVGARAIGSGSTLGQLEGATSSAHGAASHMESCSVLQQLGEERLPDFLRLIAAAEDRAGGPVYKPALVYLLRNHSRAHPTMPPLGSSQVDRLLTRELVRAGYVDRLAVTVIGRDIDERRIVEVFQLARQHPTVAGALELGSIELPENFLATRHSVASMS